MVVQLLLLDLSFSKHCGPLPNAVPESNLGCGQSLNVKSEIGNDSNDFIFYVHEHLPSLLCIYDAKIDIQEASVKPTPTGNFRITSLLLMPWADWSILIGTRNHGIFILSALDLMVLANISPPLIDLRFFRGSDGILSASLPFNSSSIQSVASNAGLRDQFYWPSRPLWLQGEDANPL
ncbi:unnamed protein product, partial [Protopolystoma xenopodis]